MNMLLFLLIMVALIIVSAGITHAIFRAPGKRAVSDSYWYELQIDRARRPAHASLLFNFTKAQTAVVWTQSWEENLGVVVLGSVPPAPWTPEDDIRVIGYMSADAMKELTPRPAAVPSGK